MKNKFIAAFLLIVFGTITPVFSPGLDEMSAIYIKISDTLLAIRKEVHKMQLSSLTDEGITNVRDLIRQCKNELLPQLSGEVYGRQKNHAIQNLSNYEELFQKMLAADLKTREEIDGFVSLVMNADLANSSNEARFSARQKTEQYQGELKKICTSVRPEYTAKLEAVLHNLQNPTKK